MNPDNFLVEHCMVCDVPVCECDNPKHAKIRKKYRKLVVEASFLKS